MSSVEFVDASRDAAPPLDPGEVHLWCARLAATEVRFAALAATLSDEERTTAGRYRRDDHSRRFIVTRAVLRELLGRYLNIRPQQVALAYGPFGKPHLATDLSDTPVQFNLAHSGDLALYGVTLGQELGVDLEVVVRQRDFRGIAERYFSPREQSELRLCDGQAGEAFYSGWTRKEAYLKATGRGLFDRLDGFDVTLTPGRPAELLRVGPGRGTPADWCVRDLRPVPGVIGALAIQARGMRIRAWRRDA